MADVFISYSKREPESTKALAAALHAHGYTVWWDTNVLTGDDFRKVILKELADARAVVVIWTRSSINSDWVIGEAERAKEMRKLIPVRARDVKPLDIPPLLDRLHTDFCDDLPRILIALHKLNVHPNASPSAGSASQWKDKSVGSASTRTTPTLPPSDGKRHELDLSPEHERMVQEERRKLQRRIAAGEPFDAPPPTEAEIMAQRRKYMGNS